MSAASWHPTHDDPLFILAMDHRGSFGKTLFGVEDDKPTPQQTEQMQRAKSLIFAGLVQAKAALPQGRAGVLVDEQLGRSVIDEAPGDDIVLAVPIEASGHEWFTLEWGAQWLEHVQSIAPAYAKVLVRDNPDFPSDERTKQLTDLAAISTALHEAGVPLLYELLVPATDEQQAWAGGDTDRYDRDVRPELVARVIADNQAHGIEPKLWKVEGLETVEAAELVAAQARAGGRAAELIVLGRDAPLERLDHWLEVASAVPAYVGFAIGRSIWQDTVRDWVAGSIDDAAATSAVAHTYLGFAAHWS